MKFRVYKKLTALMLALITLLACTLPLAGAQTVKVLLGDANQDGFIRADDARFALRLAVGLEATNKNVRLICDIDKSGTVSAADARLILRASVGLESLNGETVEIDPADFPQEPKPDSSIFNIPKPQIPFVDVPSDCFVFTVYGNGHGVGMSQWGALFMARAGYNYKDILKYFYTGTTVVKDEQYPAKVNYNGEEYDTEKIVTQLVAMEIYGLVDSKQPLDDEAVKAQAVAVLSLFRFFDYNGTTNNVGYARSSYEQCDERLKKAVKSVLGEYVTLASDTNKSAVQTVYSCHHAGSSTSSEYIWGGKNSYLTAVKTPFEFNLAQQTDVYYHYENGTQNDIVDLDGNVVYSRTPQGKVVLDIRKTKQTQWFAQIHIYPREKIKAYIDEYSKNNPKNAVTLGSDPSQWFKILEHDGAFSQNCGYVRRVQIGDRVFTGDRGINSVMSLRSGCYTVEYNP